MQARLDELLAEEKALLDEREQLLKERQALFAALPDDDNLDRRRQAHARRQAEFEPRYQEVRRRRQRYFDLEQGLLGLRGTRIVSCGLSWPDGYSVDGGSALAHRLNDVRPGHTLWVQAAGEMRGQVWCNLFRDQDGNGVMEFADPKTPLAVHRWSRE